MLSGPPYLPCRAQSCSQGDELLVPAWCMILFHKVTGDGALAYAYRTVNSKS